MADENDMSATNERAVTAAPTPAPEAKKQRAARRPKVAAEAAVSTPSVASVKSPKLTRKKREAKPAVVETPSAVKTPRKARAVVETKPMAKTSVAASDAMGDLLQLEEENKTLRKSLAEKLRAENADLRRRLGQA